MNLDRYLFLKKTSVSDIRAQAPKVGDHIYFLYSGRLSGLVRLSVFYGTRIVLV
jgi:hypothetical protein